MAYVKTTWKTGDKVTSSKLNKIENGIEANDTSCSELLTAITEDVINYVDTTNFVWEAGTYNATTGAKSSTNNAIRLSNVPYVKSGRIFLDPVESGYSLRVIRMTSDTLTGADYVIETLTGTDITISSGSYIRVVLLKNGITGDTSKANYVKFDSLQSKSNVEINTDNIAKLNQNLQLTFQQTGYQKPNLIETAFASITTNTGITYTANTDRSVHATGTASDTTGIYVPVTLQQGNYILSGVNNGDSNSYSIRIIRSDDTYKDLYNGELPFTVENSTETVRIYLRVATGYTIDYTFYPMIRNADIFDNTYAAYGEYAVYKGLQELINYTKLNWSGKKMNAIGDSIVKGSNGNFINVIGGILHLSTVRNYGVGGCRIASSDIDAEYPPVCTRYTDMDNDADIIIVHAGTNDYTGQIPIGETNSTTITTFNGALNVLMSGLKTKYPKALIIFSNILDRIQDNNTDRYPVVCQTYRDAIEAACYRNHVVFYNGFKDLCFDFHKDYYDHVLSDDGLHPNQDGADIMGRSIAGFIKWH